jgi:ABC-type sugar transport system permease subunit
MKMKTMRLFYPFFFLTPFFILFLVFGLFPVIFSIFLSFQNWSGMGDMQFVGLLNYGYLLFTDTYFWKTMRITLWLLVFGSITQHFIAIPCAIMLNNKLIRGRDVFKTAYFLPYITNTISIALIFNYVFGANYGLLNFLLDSLGLGRYNWLTDKDLIAPTIATVVNWRYIGWNTVIYIAGLQAIPVALYESAEIDGANAFQKHLNITIPLLLPIIFFAITLSIIGGMQLFDEPYIMTEGYPYMGGTDNSGFTVAFYIMWQLQRAGRLGRGSAMSWVLFLVVLIMILIYRRIIQYLEGHEKESA